MDSLKIIIADPLDDVSTSAEFETFVVHTVTPHSTTVVTYEPMPIAMEATHTDRPYVFVQYIINKAQWEIARILLLETGDDTKRALANMRMIQWLKGDLFHYEVANLAFGEKIASDLGIRSSNSNPKTDYGIGVFGAGYDLGGK